MAKLRTHLPHAPVTEAVIDFRVVANKNLTVAAFEPLVERLAPDYLKKGPIFELMASFAVDPKGERSSDFASQEIGIRMHSADERYVAQFQLAGFSLSRLEPYETWDKLLAEARRLWELYVDTVGPDKVVRVATRFINNLRLPMQPGEDFGIYLTKPPQVPEGLPQGLSSFLQRILLHDQKADIRATLTQALQSLPVGDLPEHIPVILDIDVYRVTEFGTDGRELWECLEHLRAFKNLAFYESLTEKAVEQYL
jgi:uncharacterized protein (TIGR04255 family)